MQEEAFCGRSDRGCGKIDCGEEQQPELKRGFRSENGNAIKVGRM